MFDSDIKELPSAVMGEVPLLPDLLDESRAANMVLIFHLKNLAL